LGASVTLIFSHQIISGAYMCPPLKCLHFSSIYFSVVIEVIHMCLCDTEVFHLPEIYVVDCCKDENHIVVARNNSFRILSSYLKKTCHMALLFQFSSEGDSEGTDINGNGHAFFFLVYHEFLSCSSFPAIIMIHAHSHACPDSVRLRIYV
jgi:hypothetical protein